MQIFDIILMALIVVFLVLRLRGALGSRDGFDGNDKKDEGFNSDPSKPAQDSENDNVIAMPGARIEAPDVDPYVPQDEPKDDDIQFEGALADGVAAIREADPEFHAKDFLEGANFAFEMILNAYAEGNTKTLKPLLSSDVYGGFAGAIEDRETRGQTLQETLVGIGETELVEAYMDSREAHVTVKFVSEQISALLDSEGSVIEGDPTKVINATDYWTFARSTKSRNPNWTLVGTGSLS
ncbi:MAG: hypothetical protein COB46_06450 [Rhodospirillaceae bacterium]|nr:MAG: hypothetical protein COB46_06450 [Rhodospirillaceae bacterium]